MIISTWKLNKFESTDVHASASNSAAIRSRDLGLRIERISSDLPFYNGSINRLEPGLH